MTRPPTTEERMTLAPREMSSSAAPSRVALPAASITTCEDSSAMLVKLELLKKTWFWEKTPNPSTSSRSTTAIQSAGCRENESPATPKPRPKSGASGAGSVTGTVSPASIRRLQGRAKHRRHDHRDRRLFAAEVG